MTYDRHIGCVRIEQRFALLAFAIHFAANFKIIVHFLHYSTFLFLCVTKQNTKLTRQSHSDTKYSTQFVFPVFQQQSIKNKNN